MKPSDCITCAQFPCEDVEPSCFIAPNTVIPADRMRVAVIAEAAPADPADCFYAGSGSLFARTTCEAFGDVAIKSINYIAKRQGKERPVPAGSTYKIRGGEFHFGDLRVFPSYLQAGPSFYIEKSKRRMIAEDSAAAMAAMAAAADG